MQATLRPCTGGRLHYSGNPGSSSPTPKLCELATDLAALASWWQQHRAKLPRLVWMDTPAQVRLSAVLLRQLRSSVQHCTAFVKPPLGCTCVHCDPHMAVHPQCLHPQHFATPAGSYAGGSKPFKCRPLEAWARGDPLVRAGGLFNIVAAPAISLLADAHLRTWNDSVPLWDSHVPGECTHWCSPGTYQMWLYKLNELLREAGLGNAVSVGGR